MKGKKSCLLILLVMISVFAFPGAAMATPDQYGYDADARMFIGTLDNWEALLGGTPPTPFEWTQKDTIFIIRKWNRSFDPMMRGEAPSTTGAWESSYDWEYLSGDQEGWTRHRVLEMIYSPNFPIPGAIEIPIDQVGYPGFYLIRQNEWLSGPRGEIQITHNFSVLNQIIKKLFHFPN